MDFEEDEDIGKGNDNLKMNEKCHISDKHGTVQEENSHIHLENETTNSDGQDIGRVANASQQLYKEKIIDKRFKLTYVFARGGCGEIRATEDLVTGEELVCKIIPRAKKPKVDKKSRTYQYYLDYELDLLKEY